MKPSFLWKLFLLMWCVAATRTSGAQVTIGFSEPHNIITLSVPDQPPALQIDLLHLKLEQNQMDSSNTRRKMQASDTQGWVFSAFMYPLDKKQSATDLREEAFLGLREAAAKNGFKIEQMRTYERGTTSIREYVIPDFHGQRVHQKNVFGYLVSGEMGFDFHISKIAYSAADDNFFDSLINNIKLVEDYKPDSRTQFGYGSIFYLHEDWTRAAAHYEKALELEKEKRTLSPTEWTVLVDNLGMAYGMSSNISQAKAIFEYGIHESPSYPMFRYNLACADSELGDLSGALEQLKLAFQYKNHSNPGEGIPDPAKDESFKGYLSDPRFMKLAKELCPSSTHTEAGWQCK